MTHPSCTAWQRAEGVVATSSQSGEQNSVHLSSDDQWADDQNEAYQRVSMA